MANTTKQILLGAALLAGIALFGLGMNMRTEEKDDPTVAQDPDHVSVSEAAKKLVNLQTTVVETAPTQEWLHTTGQVLYSPDRTVKIAPRLQGRVRRVLVRVGDHVSEGQVLAVLDSVDAATARTTAIENRTKLQLAKLKLEAAERQFALGTPEVTTALAAVEQSAEGANSAHKLYLKAEEQARIGGFTQKPLEDAENAAVAASASLIQARADLTLAKKDLDRKTKLVQIGIAAQGDLEISRDAYDKALAAVNAATENERLAEEARTRERKAYKSNLYADQQVQQLRSAYNEATLQEVAARRALALAKAAMRADLEQARSDYQVAAADEQNSMRALALLGNPAADGSVEIRSPISGVVTERDVNPGQVVDQSQMTPWQLLVVSDPDPVWVVADVYEKDLAGVRSGAETEVHIGAMPAKSFRGRLLSMSPMIDRTSRSVKVKIEIPNPIGALKDGMYASVLIHRAGANVATIVPLSAVVHDGDKDYVFLKGVDKYDKHMVELGSIDGDSVEVLEGLKAGQTIVTHGALFLGYQQSGD